MNPFKLLIQARMAPADDPATNGGGGTAPTPAPAATPRAVAAQPSPVDPATQVVGDLNNTMSNPISTTTLADWATAGNFDVNAVMQAAKSGNIAKVNEFYNYLANKVVSQGVENFLEFTNKFTSAIEYGAEDPAVDIMEYIVTDIIQDEEYDPNERVASSDKLARLQSYFINKTMKKKWTITTADTQVLAAFTSNTSAMSFISDVMNKFATSVEVWLQNVITDLVVKNVKNVKATTAKMSAGFSGIAAEILEFMSEWVLPVNDGRALGFADGKLEDDAKYFSTTPFADMLVIGRPATLKKFTTQMATIYHNNDLQLEGFAATIPANVGEKDLYFIHKKAIKIKKRIERTTSQNWAANMKTDTYKHLWIIIGMLKVASGIKFTLTD